MENQKRLTTEELREHVHSVYARIEPVAKRDGVYRPLDVWFGRGTPNGRDGQYCYANEEGYHYGVIERGQQIRSISTQNLIEITFLALSSDVFWMAGIYECKNRIEGQDFRRLLFQKEMQYWNALGPEYAVLAEQKIRETLAKAPFMDQADASSAG